MVNLKNIKREMNYQESIRRRRRRVKMGLWWNPMLSLSLSLSWFQPSVKWGACVCEQPKMITNHGRSAATRSIIEKNPSRWMKSIPRTSQLFYLLSPHVFHIVINRRGSFNSRRYSIIYKCIIYIIFLTIPKVRINIDVSSAMIIFVFISFLITIWDIE